MEERGELRRDLHELQNLRSIASRQYVKSILDEKITDIERKKLQKFSFQIEQSAGDAKNSTDMVINQKKNDAVPLPTIKVTNYAWDQSEKYVKLYVTISNVHTVPQDRIAVTFAENEVEILVRDVDSANYLLTIKGLLQNIIPSSSTFKQKNDLLLVMMKKEKKENWKYLTKAEHQSKEKRPADMYIKFSYCFSTPKFDQKSDPQESLMTLMKQLYEDGDDEMKRTIRKAWHESQTKRSEEMGLNA
ncbi:unnamed protein product [Thelazia callipaeda]|uniref:Calcyclin-binding protein n=1 Tax=Thelazia callipaeda TaxID=103827 RepID=A0A0N5CP51_THECL|nr:unnamed protein product [Thelazia callipaeda]